MDLFQDCKKYSPAEMRSLNCCQLYMDVTVVSDICDASGRNLLVAATDGDKDALPSRSRTEQLIRSVRAYLRYGVYGEELCLS
jgi:hypothetical protein